jgi:hypothetical protein
MRSPCLCDPVPVSVVPIVASTMSGILPSIAPWDAITFPSLAPRLSAEPAVVLAPVFGRGPLFLGFRRPRRPSPCGFRRARFADSRHAGPGKTSRLRGLCADIRASSPPRPLAAGGGRDQGGWLLASHRRPGFGAPGGRVGRPGLPGPGSRCSERFLLSRFGTWNSRKGVLAISFPAHRRATRWPCGHRGASF